MITFPLLITLLPSSRTSLSGVVSEGVAEVETAGVAYPVDARIDKAIDEAQTREGLIDPAIETAGWTKTSCPLLAGEGLDVAFPQVLDAAEEGESGKMLRQVNGQIVEDKANKVIARGDVLPVETAGLVDEDADFLCLFHS